MRPIEDARPQRQRMLEDGCNAPLMVEIRAREMILACLSGVLLILSFPEWDFDFLAWVALVPLLIALEGKSLKKAFLLSYATGLLNFTGIYLWNWNFPAFNLLDFGLFAAYVALVYGGLFGVGLNWVRIRTDLPAWLVAPPLWVTVEYVRSHASFLSAPWMLLGHTQYQHPYLIQITSFTGVYGVSFLIMLVNTAIAEAIQYGRGRCANGATESVRRPFPLTSQAIAGLLLVISWSYGFFVLSQKIEGDHVSVALVQGHVPKDQKWDKAHRRKIFDRYVELTRSAARGGPSLIVWPETSVQGDVKQSLELQQELGRLAVETKTYLLVGTGESAKSVKRNIGMKNYNSVVLLSPEGKVEGDYRKMRLVPFGEYEPLKGFIHWPEAIASAMDDTVAGDQYTLLSAGSLVFGATICWENSFPDLFREFVRRGARFMVNASDESWFGELGARHQFLVVSAFRAVENRVAIARATNMGISAFIDPYGRITDRLGGRDETERLADGVLRGELVLSETQTFYTRYGDIFALLQITVLGLICLMAVMRRRKALFIDKRRPTQGGKRIWTPTRG